MTKFEAIIFIHFVKDFQNIPENVQKLIEALEHPFRPPFVNDIPDEITHCRSLELANA